MPIRSGTAPRILVLALAAGVLVGASTFVANADEPPPQSKAVRPSVVDVLMVYSPGALKGAGDERELRRIAHRAGASANRAFANSRAAVRTRIVGVVAAPDYPDADEGSAGYTYLFKKPASLARLREKYHADVVGLFAAETGGFSNSVSRPVPRKSQGAGAMLLIGYDRTRSEPDLYFTHELGHLLGLMHDFDSDPPYTYARGYIPPSMKWRDIMAYASTCEAVGKKCPLIPYFSNPRLRYRGEALGVPKGQPGEADAVSMLNASAPIVAAYR